LCLNISVTHRIGIEERMSDTRRYPTIRLFQEFISFVPFMKKDRDVTGICFAKTVSILTVSIQVW
jgi:hypothetical protein